ncbi:MAG: tetratricopeptide repeat protein [Gammaproteobacteria bacterium]|jgi:TolB-like protein
MSNSLKRLSTFFSELKRRKVYQVTAVYLVLAVAGMEFLDVLIPSTQLPQWASPFFLALAIIGLPVVAVLAWTFDLTSDGLTRTEERPARPGHEPAAQGASDTDAGALMHERPTDGRAAAEGLDANTVAVLPFENLSGAPDPEPFAVGLHDDLLTELSRASALTVISRTSVNAYRGTNKPLPQIAKELGAGTIVEGGLQKAGNRVRLNVQLVDARNDVQRWAERYDRELSADNIFDLQSELATKIMAALRAQLTRQEQARARRQQTHDLEAYRLYSVGRERFVYRTAPDLREAAAAFQRAIELDPDYAAAWAGLGMALGSLVDYGHVDDADTLRRSREAVRRALELDPELPEGHAAEGGMLIHLKDGEGAKQELARAIALGPGLSLGHQWTSWVELLTGSPRRAAEAAERATRLDPLEPEAWGNLAMAYLGLGRVEDALAAVRQSHEHYPDVDYTLWAEGLALYHLGKGKDVPRIFQGLTDRWSAAWPDTARALSRIEEDDETGARKLTAQLRNAGATRKAGIVHAALGEMDAAFEAFAAPGESFWDDELFLRYHRAPPMDAVRADPRYAELIGQLDRAWGLRPT